MKKAFVLGWMLVPVAMIAWHYGPGQAQLARDRAGEHIRAARAAAAENDWQRAAAFYARAAEALPEEDQPRRNRLRLAQACTRIRAGQMIEGQEQLQKLLSDLEEGEHGGPALVASVRHELATASYYAAWLMRLEGAGPEEWKPEAQRARQQFRLLAERSGEAGDGNRGTGSVCAKHPSGRSGKPNLSPFKKNLEATIRLERMDLSTLKAKPLPKDCPCCKNLSQRKRKQCQSRCKGKGKKKGEKKQDARQIIKQDRGAGLNERDGTGS